MEKRQRTIRPNNVSETTTKKKTDDCIDDPPLPDATALSPFPSTTRRRRRRAKKDARARFLIATRFGPSSRQRETFYQCKAQKCKRRKKGSDRIRAPKTTLVEEDAPSRRLGGFRRDNFRAGKTRALCCKHNVASCRFLLWRVSRETCSFGHERERETEREKKGGKSSTKNESFPFDFLSLFFCKTLNMHIGKKRSKFFEKKSVNTKPCHHGCTTTSVVCKEERRNKEKWTRQPPAETTRRRSRKHDEEKKNGEGGGGRTRKGSGVGRGGV